MRRLVTVLLVILAACGGKEATVTTPTAPDTGRAAVAYAASAMRALDGTAFEDLGVEGVAEVVAGLCEGLGVGAIGVAAADTGIEADDADVAIFLEVLRTGLDQVCEEKVVVDLTAIYLRSIQAALGDDGGGPAYDEIALVRAAPVVCRALDSSDAGTALLEVVFTLYGVDAGSVEGLEGRIDADEGLVAGAALASATALLCPEHLPVVETFMDSL